MRYILISAAQVLCCAASIVFEASNHVPSVFSLVMHLMVAWFSLAVLRRITAVARKLRLDRLDDHLSAKEGQMLRLRISMLKKAKT